MSGRKVVVVMMIVVMPSFFPQDNLYRFSTQYTVEHFNLIFSRHLRELQLEKVQLELQNKEMEKKLQLLQANMSREKEEREWVKFLYNLIII